MINLPGISGTTYAVMGLGASGLAAAEALARAGARVLAWDDNEKRRQDATNLGVTVSESGLAALEDSAALVLSPGIPHTWPTPHPIAALARDKGIPIICDIELLTRARSEARFIGVTGTNGKSTVTALLGHIFETAGRKAEIGGNLGPAALSLEELGPDGTYILELSSYQLERLETQVFDIAILINISPDHLDRHGGIDGYIAAKEGLFDLTRSGAIAVIGIDDAHCRAMGERLAHKKDLRIIPISAHRPVPGGIWVDGFSVIDDTGDARRMVADLSDARALPGRHNMQNAAAATAAALAAGLDPDDIAYGLISYPGLPHRQETVRHIAKVSYINDSKATNPEAAQRAIACYENIYWIAGGRAKDGGFEDLAPGFGHIRHAYLIGEAATDIARTLGGRVPHTCVDTLAAAVQDAAQAAQAATGSSGEQAVVLLSPACASFDQFANFEDRGNAFRDAVNALGEAAA